MKIVRSVVQYSVDRPWQVISTYAVLVLLSLVAASGIHLHTSNLDLIDNTLPEVEYFYSFAEKFGTPNSLIIVLHSSSEEQLPLAASAIASRLRMLDGVRRVLDKFPTEVSKDRSIQYSLFWNSDHSACYLFVQPSNITTEVHVIAPLVAKVEQEVAIALAAYPEVRAGYTGIPRYALDDQTVIQRDISILSAVSLIAIAALFIFAFHSVLRPLLAIASLLASVFLTLGLVTIVPGHLSLLSAPFAMMIFGLGIDFGIHLITRTEEALADGEEKSEAICTAVCDLFPSLSTACLTTTGVFLGLLLSSFLGFRELGLIAGMGLTLAFISMCTLFPALQSLYMRPHTLKASTGGDFLGTLLSTMPIRPLGVTFLLLTLGFCFFVQPSFDANYLNLQPKDSSSVALEQEMVQNSSFSPYFAVFVVDSISEADALSGLLSSFDEVAEVRSLSELINFPDLSEEEKEALLKKPRDEWPTLDALDIPEEYRDVFLSKDGHFAVYAFPAGDIWDPAVERAFLSVVTSADSSVSGMPVLSNLMIGRTKKALVESAFISLCVVGLFLALDLRRPLLWLFAMLPPLFSIVWMQGVMDLFGMSYNPLNIVALPIVLGIAVDDSIHVIHRFLKEEGNVEKTLFHTGRSITLTTLTTLAAFGSLAFTSHRGLQSFSLLLLIGVSAALCISLFVVPWLLTEFRARICK